MSYIKIEEFSGESNIVFFLPFCTRQLLAMWVTCLLQRESVLTMKFYVYHVFLMYLQLS